MRDWKQFVRSKLPPLDLLPAREAEIVEELAQQLEQTFTDSVSRGKSEANAEAAAESQVRDWKTLARNIRYAETTASQRAAVRLGIPNETPVWGNEGKGNMFEDFLQDLRYALRTMRKNPAFAVIAVLTLGLGIGANTAIFTVVNAVLLRAMPYEHPEQLVTVWERVGEGKNPVSYPNYLDWEAQNSSFSSMAAYGRDDVTISSQGNTERVFGEFVAGEYFELLGVRAHVGRTFLPEEKKEIMGHPVALLGYDLWQRKFAASADVVGQHIKINDADFVVVGVMPAGFKGFLGKVDIWTPMVMRDALWPQVARFHFLEARDIHWHRVVARLKPGVSVEQAQADLGGIAGRLALAYPLANEKRSAGMGLSQEVQVSGIRTSLWVLLGAVGFILLIACANVANLFLARAMARTREIAVRAALGAARGRLIRQWLTEGLLIAGFGGGLGLLLAIWGIPLLHSILPVTIPGFARITMDASVLIFTLGISVFTGVGMSIAPAMSILRKPSPDFLREGGRSGAGVPGARLRGLLVISEVALTLLLMAGAGLMLRSVQNLLTDGVGFDPAHMLTLRLDVPSQKYTDAERVRFGERLLEKARAIPGVQSAAATYVDLFLWSGISREFTIEGRPRIAAELRDSVYYHEVSDGYFQTLGVPIRAGREFSEADNLHAPRVLLISESFARLFFANEDPIGKRIKFGPPDSKEPWQTIIGVSGNMKFQGLRLDAAANPILYAPLRQTNVIISLSLLVRTPMDPASLTGTLRSEIQRLDPEAPVYNVTTLEERMSELVVDTRSYSLLLGLFATLGTVLAVVGIYGVLSYQVTQRTREIGVRMALGAQRGDVFRLVISQSVRLLGVGIAIGLAGALALTRWMESLLFHVRPNDPVILAGVVVLLSVVALAASYVPARRAMLTDPMVALRYE